MGILTLDLVKITHDTVRGREFMILSIIPEVPRWLIVSEHNIYCGAIVLPRLSDSSIHQFSSVSTYIFACVRYSAYMRYYSLRTYDGLQEMERN